MSTIIFNKKIVPAEQPCINHADRGVTLGHGLFETILVKKNTIPALDYHWRRLEESAPLIGITLPFSFQELKVMLTTLIVENNLQDKIAGARVTLTHGDSERGLLPLHSPQPNFLISVFEYKPITHHSYSALIVNTRKNEHSVSSRIKSISYIDNILAKQEAMSQGYDEAILLNTASNVADGSISNVYIVKDGKIFTPPVSDGALPGVIRSILFDELKDISIEEKTISVQEIMTADEVFLTNALMGVQLLTKLNLKELYDNKIGNQIKEELKKIYTI